MIGIEYEKTPLCSYFSLISSESNLQSYWAEGNADSSLYKLKQEPPTREQQRVARPDIKTAAYVKFPEW